jgi:hypothetical protein
MMKKWDLCDFCDIVGQQANRIAEELLISASPMDQSAPDFRLWD